MHVVGVMIGLWISCYNEVVLDLVDPLDSKVCVYSGRLCILHMSGMQHPYCPPVHISTSHSSLSTCMHS